MKTNVHLWWYLAEFFAEWEMFHRKVIDKIKTHILYSLHFFPKAVPLWDNVKKYGTARGDTDDMSMWIKFAICVWLLKIFMSPDSWKK